ncbi:hypothetical protein COT70_00510 [candidate division WWE3 bacterium CG09_land_8_20_14_0_10_47_33]|uniref:Rubredoxin-like domain-containing protein n=1 Tax=candidate division WWE3 bacterium CG_4_9_14_0_2_um_filter_48_10 TaxID=1975078 RepID=A0A2M8EI86_UNCKA|nr:MAG: hypothetical protein COT70_00510 [candidate division WWE3 bacterium CG09_land_8_20_14_0_10_47_33]PIZ40726.1 MAG: hypothetical protein COY35_01770 [candidate division WWE3 bacterium CG_4_10_14_0_2_um_filter_47_8]PJC22161.1 MAG: hypothetical protein CO059_02850 [candidate division WWE3 bacterium CG_4_9_14_0_2_um_filter_48_10]PJE52346.1 MAG: hypothetical protein COV28_00195 [candidate division WWE3 bacterium CG10_big_fil_rev_8_21_14_0_10_48_23]
MEDNVCKECGYEGPESPGEGKCPACGGEIVSAEEIEEGGEEGFGKEEHEEKEHEKELEEDEEF